MKITQIEPQKKNPKRFNIFLNGEFGFGADEDSVVKFRLVVGKEISQSDLDKILMETEVGKLMSRMYRWFGIRMRSEKEVRDYLKVKSKKEKVKKGEEISELIIEQLVENLKQKGIVSDERFAEEWVEARSKKKGWRMIQSELSSKGIDREIIENIKLGVKNEKETAEKLLEKKAKVWENLPKLEFKKKAIGFLMRRGFEYEVAKKVVEKSSQRGYNAS